MPDTLMSLALNGMKWTYTSSLTVGLLQIVTASVLARLLEPKAFGLIAMGGVVLRFGNYFSHFGMGSAIVQKHTLTSEDIRSAFTFSIGLSLVFLSLFWVVSPAISLFFAAPELLSILPVMAFSFVFTGFSTTAIGLLRREFKFQLLAMSDILGYLIGYGVVGMYAALSGAGAWSLVYASLTQTGIIGLLAYAFTRHEVKPLFSYNRGRQLASFGGKVSIIGFLEFVSSNLDMLAIGQVMGAVLLGLYSRAYMLVNVPMQYLSGSLSRVLLTSFSRIQGDIARIERSFRVSMLVMATILFPVCFGITGAASEIILTLLGEQWKDAIPILRILALSTPFMLLSHIEAVLLEATAHLTIKLYIQLVSIFALCSLFFILLPYGLIGLASAISLRSVGLLMVYTAALKKFLSIPQRKSYENLSPGILCGCIISIILPVFSDIMARLELNIVLALIVQFSIGGMILYLLILSPLQNPFRREVQRILRQPSIPPRLRKPIQRLFWLGNF